MRNQGNKKSPDPKRSGASQPDPIRGGEPAESPETEEGADLPSAGPHADPSLINSDATPGAGALPRPGDREEDSTSG